jgi:methylglutamate dehydrogenase subunit D
VSELRLTPTSSLRSAALPATHGTNEVPGVVIAERSGLSICSMLARRGAEARLADRVRQVFGVELPRMSHYTGPGPIAFAWAGRSHWLALQDNDEGGIFERQLRSSLAGVASVMDQSDGRTIMRISGPRARDTLAKGVLIDLHPSAFRPGDAAITTVSYIGVNFWQVDAAPTYEFMTFRSFAVAFWEWLVDAAEEYGVTVEYSSR